MSESVSQWQDRIERLLRERQEQGSVFVVCRWRQLLCDYRFCGGGIAACVETASPAWKRLDVSVLHYGACRLCKPVCAGAQPTMAYARAGDEVFGAGASCV